MNNNRNRHLDIDRLALISAILVLLGDFIDLLVTYQVYCDRLDLKYERTNR